MQQSELLTHLEDAQLYHALATNPSRVLPPGKSLTSMFARQPRSPDPNNPNPRASLEEQVGSMIKQAFWDEASQALLSLQPGVPLARLQLLYKDIYNALLPIVPSDEPLLTTFSNPISPSNVPMQSALRYLRSALVVLRRRCAPIRDDAIDQLIQDLDAPYDASETPAQRFISILKATLELAEDMKSDIRNYVVSTLTEDEIKRWVRKEAKDKERLCILQIYGGLEGVQKKWQTWITSSEATYSKDVLPRASWKARILQALTSNIAVSFPLPPRTENTPSTPNLNILPPPLGFSLVELLHVQNVMQALIIAAALQSLVPAAPPSQGESDDFLQRTWAMLVAEIETDTDTAEGHLETKIIHLGDEVIRAKSRVSGGVDAETEQRLRAAVNRILRVDDPVWTLLQRRIADGFLVRLKQLEDAPAVPAYLRSGTGLRGGGRTPSSSSSAPDARPRTANFLVRGFESPVLQKGLMDMFEELLGVLRWLKEVWPDAI